MYTITLLENLRAVFYTPFYVAIDRGYFSDAGVDVQFIESPDPGDTLPRLLSGEIDVCWGGPLRVLRTYDQDPNCGLVCFGEVVGRDPFLLVGRGFEAQFSLADLAGKRVSVVSEVPTPWICLQQDLADAGVAIADIEVHTDRTMAANEAALAAGDIDVFQAFQPYVEQAVDRAGPANDTRILYVAADRGPTAYTSFYTTKSTLAKRQDEFGALAGACRRAVEAVYAEGGAGVVSTLRRFFPDEPPERLMAAVDRYIRHRLYNPTGVLSEPGFERLKQSMITAGFITTGAAYADCVENSLMAP
ncbi:MAG: NitT/TauT family transport system substrate-binding protein [Gammaproteobacteria bacterium]|jgi:NitT/TauT family transport system substrate-binding protein